LRTFSSQNAALASEKSRAKDNRFAAEGSGYRMILVSATISDAEVVGAAYAGRMDGRIAIRKVVKIKRVGKNIERNNLKRKQLAA
jgi:hypothetical protein